MGVKRTTPKSAVDAYFERALKCLHTYMLNALTKLGEECIVKIRDRDARSSWIDRTGNLRSSIGYAVYAKGMRYMQSSFEPVLSASQGPFNGRKMIVDLASQYSDTYALVVVAAMDYADKVEALENKDVLESTRIWAQSVVNSKLERAKEEALKVINSWTL